MKVKIPYNDVFPGFQDSLDLHSLFQVLFVMADTLSSGEESQSLMTVQAMNTSR